tara:strand:- start:26749 stop:27609 length:861 start_codon:yes stop_codon:yes gene_type:complete
MSNIPIIQHSAEILSNREIGPGLYWIDLLSPEITSHAKPGHFVHLITSNLSKNRTYPAYLSHTPLLRRPFSVAERDPETGVIGLIYRVVGGGTEVLAMRPTGEYVDLIGPLGRPLKQVEKGKSVIMVAGGVGVAPFLSLVQETIRTKQATNDKITVLFGAANAGLLSGEEKFRDLGVNVKLATDDGSMGYHGLVTDLLIKEIGGSSQPFSFIYSCGPTSMMRLCQKIAREVGIPGQVSLEGIMPCGVGVCMACVVPCINPEDQSKQQFYERVCDKGPVFDINEVVF